MTASSVDCAWLADRLFATGSPHDLLLLDVRPIEKYAEGHVNGAINLTCSNLMLRRLKKGNLALSVLVNGDEAKAKFAARRNSHYVVLYDENSSSSELIDLIATKLRDESLNQIRILEGGFCVLSKSHPDVCKAKCHRNARPGSLPHLNLSNLSIGSPLPRRGTVSAGAVSPSRRHHDTSKPVQIRAHLFVGSEKDAHDLKTLDEFRITHILNVTSHVLNKFEAMDDGGGSGGGGGGGGGEAAQPQNKKEETIAEASEGAPAAPRRRRRFTYKRIAVQDNWTQDLSAHFEEAIQFINDARSCGGRVLVHCVAGISRSVTVTIAYIMQEFDLSLNDAFDFVKQRKSDVSPNFGFMGQLLEFQKKLDKRKRDSVFSNSRDEAAVPRHCPNFVELCAH